MSTEHKSLTSDTNKAVGLTSFHGGHERGRMLQLTQVKVDHTPEAIGRTGSVQLTVEQAEALRDALDHWLVGDLGGDPGGCLEGNAFDEPGEEAKDHPWGAAARF